MSKERAQLEKSLEDLVGSIDRLAAVLGRYKDAAADLTARVHAGAPVSDALSHTGEPTLRPVLAQALGAFMYARSRTRIGLLTAAVAEGEPVAEVRRALHPTRAGHDGAGTRVDGAGTRVDGAGTRVDGAGTRADGAAEKKERPAPA